MRLRAYWQFFKELYPFIVAFTALSVTFFGILWGYVLCVTAGLIFGCIGFYTFKRNQFYFYSNIGLTPLKLVSVAFVFNGLISFVLLFLLQLLFIFIRG